MKLTINYFASAADYAGRRNESIDLPASCSLEMLRQLLAAGKNDDFYRLLKVCAFTLNGQQLHDGDQVGGGELDVLPPFAGG